MFVHFSVKKVCTSAKLTPFWRGPFKVTGKLLEVLYKVNCGRNNDEQIIHCDRIKLCRQQVLRGELEQSDCGNTFKLKSYLEKHKRTQHQAWASINRTLKRSAGHLKVGLKTNSHVAKVDVDEEKHNLDDQSKVKDSKEKQVSDGQVQKKEVTVSTAKKVESVDLVSEENSDWDKSPDVSLEGELQVSDDSDSSSDNDSRRQEIKKDKVDQISVEKEKELWLGRVIRKATTPAIPVAPKKQKVDETPENDDIGQKGEAVQVKNDNVTLKRKKGDMREYDKRGIV